MSSPEEKLFATTAARVAAFPVLVGHLVAGFSEFARLNLAMHGGLFPCAQNTRDNILALQTRQPRAWNRPVGLPPFAASNALPDIPGKHMESVSPRRLNPSR